MSKESPDLSEFLALSKPKKPRCRVAVVLGELQAPENEKLEAALATDQGVIPNVAVSKWLEARGHDVGWQNVLSHRAGRCSCGRS